MSVSDRSADSSKKLINLLFILSVIVVLFVALIVTGLLLYNYSQNHEPAAIANNSSTAVDNTHISLEGPLPTLVSADGVTRTSLLQSMKLVLTTGEGGQWLAENPDWRLFKAQADYVDGHGLAKYWNLVIKSKDSVLLAYVDNGAASILASEDNGASDQPPLERQTLLDSNYLVTNVTSEKEIGYDNNTHFSFTFSDDELGGTYALAYVDPVDSSKSFNQSYSAKNGEAIDDTT